MLNKLKAWWNETEGQNNNFHTERAEPSAQPKRLSYDEKIEQIREQEEIKLIRSSSLHIDDLDLALKQMKARIKEAEAAEMEAARKSSTLVHLLNLVEELSFKQDMIKNITALERVRERGSAKEEYVIFAVRRNEEYDEQEIIEEIGLKGAELWSEKNTKYRDYGFSEYRSVWTCKAREYFRVLFSEKNKENEDFIENVMPKAIASVEMYQKNEAYIQIIEQYGKPLSTILDIVKDSKELLGEVSDGVFEGVKKITQQIIRDIKEIEKAIEEEEKQRKKDKAKELEDRMELEMDYVENFIVSVNAEKTVELPTPPDLQLGEAVSESVGESEELLSYYLEEGENND